ncbi:MAG TPA: DUF2800 domain-containing protein [Flavobacterium sp.]|nr:DUF2800 domain-containing protein [Flavobacterium sp.]
MGQHAILSPSKSSMWLNCTPSARLGEQFETGSEAADEGTLAHKLSEVLLLYDLGRITKTQRIKKVEAIQRNKHYTASMMEHCSQFAAYVIEQYNEMEERHGNAMIFLEIELDLSSYIPEGFGTGDVIIVAGNILQIIDLKYGKGVFVEVKDNTQMMIYALGAMEYVQVLADDIKDIYMTIYQPRLDNIASSNITVKGLLTWAKETLMPKAKLAFAGKGKRVSGSHCTFCPVKATCKAHANYNLELTRETFDEPQELSDEDLVEIYLRAKQMRAWLTAVEEFMLDKAVRGKKWKGLKLVHGRSVRILTNPAAILKILKAKKLPSNLYLSEPQLLGITALETNIGASEFTKIAGKYIVKPKGKPSLVHADRKGQEYSPANSAKDVF